jgi:hypothetical protein
MAFRNLPWAVAEGGDFADIRIFINSDPSGSV